MKKSMKKPLIITVVVLLLAGGAFGLYTLLTKDSEGARTSTTQPPSPFGVNYDPPSEEEQEAGDKQKEKIVESESNKPPSSATVVIIDAGQYDGQVEVRSFVSNVIQSGTCTVTFTKGNAVVTRQVEATKDATTTLCSNVSIPRSEFDSSGTWKLTVNYASSAISGQARQDVQIN